MKLHVPKAEQLTLIRKVEAPDVRCTKCQVHKDNGAHAMQNDNGIANIWNFLKEEQEKRCSLLELNHTHKTKVGKTTALLH